VLDRTTLQLAKVGCFMANRSRKNGKKPRELPGQANDDAGLVARVAAGCGESFGVLFQRHASFVYRIAHRILRDQDEAEETMHDVFLDLHRTAYQFDQSKGSFKSWLLQFVYHRTFDRRRRLQARHFYDLARLDELLTTALVNEPMRPLCLAPQEMTCLTEELFATLEEPERNVCELRLIHGLTIKQIMKQTGDSFSVVRRYFYVGRAKLRSLVRDGHANESKSEVKESI
jgi:RNA polymerase sigma-70 factor (ECF subfamily)